MKGSILKKLVFLLIVIIGAVCVNYSYGEPVDNTGNNSQTFNATININFKNMDETKWEFDNYDDLRELKVYTETRLPLEGLNYEYVWSNGQTGTGTTNSEGMVSLEHTGSSQNTSVTIIFKDCTQRFIIEVPEVNEKLIIGQKVYSENYGCFGWSGIWLIYVDFVSGSANIDLYRMPAPATINIKFLHEDGSEWILSGNNKLPSLNISDTLSYPTYSGKYNNNNSYQNDGFLIQYCEDGQNQNDIIDGSSSLNLLVYGVGDETKLSVGKKNLAYFSKVVINGIEHKFVDISNEKEVINLKPGETINLEYYIAETATGTIEIDTYDGILSEDLSWNLHFDIMDADYSNEDLTNAYWTFEGDDTIYKPVKSTTVDEYIFDIQIPFGTKVTLHNIPIYSMFHNGESFQNNYVSADNKISSAFESKLSGKTVISYKGENITEELLEKFNFDQRIDTYYTSKSGANDKPVGVCTSGNLATYNMFNGFEIKWYVFRNQTQIMFQKEYDNKNQLIEKDKKFHFRVKLMEPITKKPLSGKIAYYIYSDKEQVVDIVNDVKYATLDAEGYMDVYLKAGEYIRIGKELSDEEIVLKKLKFSKAGIWDGNIETNTEDNISNKFFSDLGMLPYGVEYIIEEVEENYECVVDKEGAESGIRKIIGSYSNIKYTAGEYYTKFNGFKFTNSRKAGSLTIQKVVEGKETDEKFKFNIKIIDAAKQFPLEYEYVDENGDVGKINFVEGEKIIKNNIEYTEYTTIIELKSGQKIIINDLPAGAKYEVTEALESMEGYNSEMSGATGEIKADDSDVKSIVSCLNKEIIVEEDKKEEIEEDKKEEIEEDKKEEIEEDKKEEIEEDKKEEIEEDKKEEIEEDKKEEVEEEAKQENKKDESPKTGDAILLITSVLAVSIIVFMITSIKIKKKNK